MKRPHITAKDSERAGAAFIDVDETNLDMAAVAIDKEYLRSLIWENTGPRDVHARGVLSVLVCFAPKAGKPPLTPKVIATRVGYSRVRHVHKALNSLKEDGWVRVAPDGTIQVLLARFQQAQAEQQASSPQD